MSADDLEILGKLKTPASGEEARELAVFSAMDAFDAADVKKDSAQTQGNETPIRPTSIVNRFWSVLMNSVLKPAWNVKPATMAAVAGVVMLPFAGVVAWNAVGPGAGLPLEQLPGSELKKAKDAKVGERGAPKLERTSAGRSDGVTAESDSEIGRVQAPAKSRIAPSPEPARKPAVQVQPLQDTAVADQAETFVPAATSVEKRKRELNSSIRMSPPKPGIEPSRENYTQFDDNVVKAVTQVPVSTFSIDVDTASYARVRSMLNSGNLPPKDMVRVEEMVNYFDYDYALPETRTQPFKPSYRITPTPWNAETQLLHIGIKGFDVQTTERPKANLVFLLDVSGSMGAEDKLPLLIKSFRLLLQKLNPTDTVSIVTYAGNAGTVLKPTQASDRSAILNALENLSAGGSTGGAQGIEQAYRLAEQSFVKDGVNRVMLATDGDFNVGISDPKQLKNFIAKKRKSGIFLSVFGFGTGNYNDALMQSLAQNGNGTAAYIDTLAEAQKTLVEEAGSTLFPIANDVKIQIEFDPARISEYRLIGYETRALKREDFNNDKVDAGEIGAGHSVTAIYELTPVGSKAALNDPLRYGKPEDKPKVAPRDADGSQGEIGFLKMRYKLPGSDKSILLETTIDSPWGCTTCKFIPFPAEQRFSTAVAAFGQKLRGNSALADMDYQAIAELAESGKGKDKFGYRSAFVQLVRMAGSLSN